MDRAIIYLSSRSLNKNKAAHTFRQFLILENVENFDWLASVFLSIITGVIVGHA